MAVLAGRVAAAPGGGVDCRDEPQDPAPAGRKPLEGDPLRHGLLDAGRVRAAGRGAAVPRLDVGDGRPRLRRVPAALHPRRRLCVVGPFRTAAPRFRGPGDRGGRRLHRRAGLQPLHSRTGAGYRAAPREGLPLPAGPHPWADVVVDRRGGGVVHGEAGRRARGGSLPRRARGRRAAREHGGSAAEGAPGASGTALPVQHARAREVALPARSGSRPADARASPRLPARGAAARAPVGHHARAGAAAHPRVPGHPPASHRRAACRHHRGARGNRAAAISAAHAPYPGRERHQARHRAADRGRHHRDPRLRRRPSAADRGARHRRGTAPVGRHRHGAHERARAPRRARRGRAARDRAQPAARRGRRDRDPAMTPRFGPPSFRLFLGKPLLLRSISWRGVAIFFVFAIALAAWTWSGLLLITTKTFTFEEHAEYFLSLVQRNLLSYFPMYVLVAMADSLALAGNARRVALGVALVGGALLAVQLRCAVMADQIFYVYGTTQLPYCTSFPTWRTYFDFPAT